MLCKKSILKNFANFTPTLTQLFSCEFCEIFNNIFLYRKPPVAASVKCRFFEMTVFPRSYATDYCFLYNLIIPGLAVPEVAEKKDCSFVLEGYFNNSPNKFLRFISTWHRDLNFNSLHKQPPEVFCKKKYVLKNFTNFT